MLLSAGYSKPNVVEVLSIDFYHLLSFCSLHRDRLGLLHISIVRKLRYVKSFCGKSLFSPVHSMQVATYFTFRLVAENQNLCNHRYVTDGFAAFLHLTILDSLMLSPLRYHRMVISNLNRLSCVYQEKAKIMEGYGPQLPEIPQIPQIHRCRRTNSSKLSKAASLGCQAQPQSALSSKTE